MEKTARSVGEPSFQTNWWRVFLIFGAGVVCAFQMGKVPPVIPQLQAELGMTLVMAGWILSASSILGALAAPAVGAVSDWLGHRSMIITGLIFVTVGSLFGASAGTEMILSGARVLEGIGYISITVSAPSLIMRVTHPNDTRIAFGIWASFFPFGAAIMMVLAPLLANMFGWRGLWVINGILPFFFLMLILFTTNDLKRSHSRDKNPISKMVKDIGITLRSPGPVLFALCFTMLSFQFMAIMGFLPKLFMEQEQLTKTMAGLLSAIAVAIDVPGNLFGGWLMQKGVKKWYLIIIVNIVTGVCCFAFYNEHLSLISRYIFCLIFSGVGGILPAAVMHGAAMSAPKPDLVATSQGFIFQGGQLGTLMGPVVMAAVVSYTGHWQSGSWLLLFPSIIGLFLSLKLRKMEI